MFNEINYLKKARHPNILMFIGVGMDPSSNLLLLTELCEENSLKAFLKKQPGKLSFNGKCKVLFDVAKAMLYMHSQWPPVIHRDIKSENIFVTATGTAKLGDFGISKVTCEDPEKEYRTETVGTLQYMAPECMHSSNYSTASDIYAFGVVGWELFTEEQPHEGKYEFELINSVVNKSDLLNVAKIKAAIPKELKDLISKCLSYQPNERPSAEQICEVLRDLCFKKFYS